MSIAALLFAALLTVYLLWQAERAKNTLRKQLADTQTENRALVLALTKRPPHFTSAPEAEPEGNTIPNMIPQRRRSGRFVSFGAAKRSLESQPEPQRSVNV